MAAKSTKNAAKKPKNEIFDKNLSNSAIKDDGSEQAQIGITTYMERSLHASLKMHVCPKPECHEMKVGRYVADVCDGGVIFEIQTGNLGPLRKKIQYYLENTDFKIVVVKPVAKTRRILWLDPTSGEITNKKARPSPHRENIFSGISDIWYLRELFGNERLSFCFVIMEIDEIRALDGYGKSKKKRATSLDRLAGEIFEEKYIHTKRDIEELVDGILPDEPFTREDLATALRLGGLKLWSAQKLLCELDILTCEKVKNKLVFEKC